MIIYSVFKFLPSLCSSALCSFFFIAGLLVFLPCDSRNTAIALILTTTLSNSNNYNNSYNNNYRNRALIRVNILIIITVMIRITTRRRIILLISIIKKEIRNDKDSITVVTIVFEIMIVKKHNKMRQPENTAGDSKSVHCTVLASCRSKVHSRCSTQQWYAWQWLLSTKSTIPIITHCHPSAIFL